jgi:hypothetical protein
MPRIALVLGLAGLLPFLAAAAELGFGMTGLPWNAEVAIKTYGAVILSFMAGVHWGLALRDNSSAGYIASVVPAILAWAAVAFLPSAPACVVLGAGFIALLIYDISVVNAGRAPQWYTRLRIGLTTVVVTCLAVAAWSQST